MEQEVILEAIGKHLDAVESTVNWIVLFAVAVSWAGIRKERNIEAFGLKVERRLAFFVASAIYLIANMMVLVFFLRIGDLLLLVEEAKLPKAVTTLATHSWLLNPYSYFGDTAIARLHSCEGYGLLIATWWLCNTSMSTLMEDKRSRTGQVMLGIFLVIGLLSMQTIQRGYQIVQDRLSGPYPQLSHDIGATNAERLVGICLGIIVGGLLFFAGNVLQERWSGVAGSSTAQNPVAAQDG
jgi:hypothetical protein